ncbi:MAG: 4Fe-4S ferredoxin N-terminal domain-containing protein [Dehalococcoidales bacterium]|nr:4Fe-4S ferredoxin N-terminal domain-containing protein [Dehalococcoidales bacterium]
MPEPTQFNPDLPKQVARDAQRLITGHLSEAEFYQKYHQAYLKEFGIDDRPINPGGGNGSPSPESVLAKYISRRTLLKLGGIGLAGIVGASFLGNKVLAAKSLIGNNHEGLLLQEDGSELEQAGRVQMGMVVDMENCDGCLECIYACSHHNSLAPGVLWLYVFAFKDTNRDEPNFLPRFCNHCSNPPCVKVCPVRARHKRDSDGLVLTDYNLCIGCRYCMVTCPYGVNYFQWDDPPPRNPGAITKFTDARGRWVIGNPPKGVMGKCEFCPERQDDGRKNLVCELSCPHNALHFGDMNDLNSRPNKYLEQKRREKGGQISTFRLLEDHGTKPNIIYIGQQPSEKAEPVDGPVSYADWGLVEKRLPLLGGNEPWFLKLFGGSQ